MKSRSEMLDWKRSWISGREFRFPQVETASSGEMFAATRKDALRIVDIAIGESVSPAGTMEGLACCEMCRVNPVPAGWR